MTPPVPKPPENPPPEGAPPTPQQAAGVAAAGAGAVDPGTQTPEQAQAASAQAMRAEADRQGIQISDADIGRIAQGVIGQLETRGAFEPPPPPPVTPPEGRVDAGAGQAGTEPPPEAPRKKTWAERFVGRN